MSVIDTNQLELPTDPNEIKKLKNLLNDTVDILTIIAGHNEVIKERKKAIKEEYGVELSKQLFKAATVKAKDTYDKHMHDYNNFELLFETLESVNT